MSGIAQMEPEFSFSLPCDKLAEQTHPKEETGIYAETSSERIDQCGRSSVAARSGVGCYSPQ